MIEVRRLSKVHDSGNGPVRALSHIDFDIEEGQFVSVVGPSGCGKSTLLRILAGLDGATTGSARLRGTPIDGPRRDLGVVFQSPVLFPWRTVLDNVMLPIHVQGQPRAAHERKARELLRMAGLEGFEGRYPHELSGGMQQRVGLIRALVHEPMLLLMDEPFGALDALTRERMNHELQRIWMEDRRTVVFVTHSISEAIFLADRVLVMSSRPGRIELDLRIDLPRPRALDLINTARFGEYAGLVRTQLNATGGLD